MADKPTTNGVIESIIAFFKDMFGFDLNAVLTLGAVPMRRAAEGLAEKLKKDLPEDHWLRGNTAETAINLVASRIEAASESQSGSVKAVLEKLSDFVELFAATFCGEDSKNGKASPKKTDAKKV